jgi:hypothetical protein
LLYTEDSPPNGGSEEGQREGDSPRSERQDERLHAFDAAVAEIAARVLPGYHDADGWLERTRTGLLALLRALDERPDAARALVSDSIAWGPEVLERRGELLEALAEVLEPAPGELEQTQDGAEPARSLPETTAENLVGASLSWVHARLQSESGQLIELAPPLMSMIVHPYLGSEAAQGELERAHADLGAEVARREHGGPTSSQRPASSRGAVASQGRSTAQSASSPQGPISRLRKTPS